MNISDPLAPLLPPCSEASVPTSLDYYVQSLFSGARGDVELSDDYDLSFLEMLWGTVGTLIVGYAFPNSIFHVNIHLCV